MKKRQRLLLILFGALMAMLLSGCWDEHELNTLSIVTGVGIDSTQDPGTALFTLQVGKVTNSSDKKGTSSEDRASFTFETEAESPLSAIEKIKYENSRTIFLHHNQVLLFSKEQAKKGVFPYLDYFLRSREARLEVWVAVVDNNAKDILNDSFSQEKFSSQTISQMMVNETNISEGMTSTLLKFSSKLLEETTAPVLPILKSQEREGEKRLFITGMAVFKDKTMVGELSSTETDGYLWATSEINGGSIDISTQEGSAVLMIDNSRPTVNISIDDKGKVQVKIDINADMTIGEIKGYTQMMLPELIGYLKTEAAKTIEEKVRSAFVASQALHSDIFGYGETIHQQYPKEWRKLENTWDSTYQNIDLAVSVKVKIPDTGQTGKTLTMGEKEN